MKSFKEKLKHFFSFIYDEHSPIGWAFTTYPKLSIIFTVIISGWWGGFGENELEDKLY